MDIHCLVVSPFCTAHCMSTKGNRLTRYLSVQVYTPSAEMRREGLPGADTRTDALAAIRRPDQRQWPGLKAVHSSQSSPALRLTWSCRLPALHHPQQGLRTFQSDVPRQPLPSPSRHHLLKPMASRATAHAHEASQALPGRAL